MSMRLGNHLELLNIDGNLGLVVHQSRNILLFDDVYFIFAKTKVVEFLQKSNGSIMSVITDHDAEWHVEASFFLLADELKSSVLASQSVLGVVFEVAVIFGNGANWKINLDA